MKDITTRLQNILTATEKHISLYRGLHHKVLELESVNQKLISQIKDLEGQILKLNQNNQTIASEQQKITNQKQREITHKINDLLSEVDKCIVLTANVRK
jgi:sugar-specific transcriptional regulator TrmB